MPVFPRCLICPKNGFKMRDQPFKRCVIKFEQVGVQEIEQGKGLMKVTFEKGETFRFKIDDIPLQLVVVGKTIDQIGRVKNQVRIGIVDLLIAIAYLYLSRISE